jgi:hypothetical protein
LKRLKMKREGELAAQVEEHRPGPATVIQFPTSRQPRPRRRGAEVQA